MDTETKKLFQVIFQEAHVVDVDFSQWDRQLRLVVSAGLIPSNFAGRGPLHNVDFLHVATFQWEANHLDVELDSSEQHCQWVIMEFDAQRKGRSHQILLSGFGPTPSVNIECGDVKISELDPRIVDRVNPDWNRPYQGLARPGFEELRRLHME